MDAEERVLQEGMSWTDRLAGFGVMPVNSGSTMLDPDWTSWERAVDPDNAGLFARRLDWDGFDVASARAVLAATRCPDSPPWIPELRALRRACRERATDEPDPALADLPFDRLLSPMANDAWQRLVDSVPSSWVQGLTPRATASLRHDVARRLADVAALAWYEDFTDMRPVGTTLLLAMGGGSDATMSERYVGWCRANAADGMEHLLTRFPVTGRLLATAALQWQRATTDLLEQLDRHRPDLEAAFGIPDGSLIADLTPGLSDEHRGGRAVCFIDFDTPGGPRRVVHKPKDLHIERTFNDLVRTVNTWFDTSAIGTIDVVCGEGDYAFTSFARQRACPSGQLPAFYRAAGRLLGLLYVLGATDAHYENVMACGEQPVLVDAETLFHPTVSQPASDDPEWAGETVLQTGMLPGWHLTGPGQAAFDPSALGVEPPPPGATATGWAHLNTDAMVRAPVPVPPDPPLSLPVTADSAHPLPRHVEDLVAGFTEFHRAARREPLRSQLVAGVEAFRGLPRRLVLRATRIYVTVQRQGLSAQALARANCRAARLELLARSSLVAGIRDPHWTVFHAELRDMENLDVPYFDYSLGSDEVRSSVGPIPGLLAADGIESALTRIERLDDDDLDRQVRLIRGSTHARFTLVDRVGSAVSNPTRSPATVDVETWGPLGSRVMADLQAAAIPDPSGDGGTWLTLTALPDRTHVALGLVSGGYYDGRAGIAAAQLVGTDLGFGTALADAAEHNLLPMLRFLSADPYRRFRHFRDMGLGFTGVGGLLRLLLLPGVIDDPDGAGRVQQVIAMLPDDLIRRDRLLDVIGGVAGMVRPLVDLARRETDPRAAALLQAAATHLVEGQRPDGGWPSAVGDRPLTGFAHGAAGGGLALIEAGTTLGRGDWIEAGASALRYESGCFDPDLGTWPDFRTPTGEQPTVMVAWCHGAPGIGLARLRALELLPEHEDAARWSRDLETAMAVTGSAADSGTDHLCCGMLGRAAVLRIAGRRQGRADWVADADRLTAEVVARHRATGRFRLPFDVPGSPGIVSPGLMTGLSGIAAHLWTSSSDEDLAHLLL